MIECRRGWGVLLAALGNEIPGEVALVQVPSCILLI